MDEPVGAADVDKRAVAGDAGHGALDCGSRLQAAEQVLALACAILILRSFLTNDQPVALSVDLEDLDRDALADQRLQAAGVCARHLARGQEAAQPEDIDDQATLVLFANVGVDHRAVGLLLGSHDPGRLRPRPAQAEDDVALFVLWLEHVDLDVVARLETDRIDLTAQAKLLAGDDSFGLGADVDQDLVRVDPDNDPIHDIAMVGGLEGLHVIVEVVLHGHRRGRVLLGRLLLFCQDGTGFAGQRTYPLKIIGVVLVVMSASAKTNCNCNAEMPLSREFSGEVVVVDQPGFPDPDGQDRKSAGS